MKWPFRNADAEARRLRERFPYDPKTQLPVIRSSICTGEKAAGFKSLSGGRFTEVMLIRTPEDERRFREIYRLNEIRKEY